MGGILPKMRPLLLVGLIGGVFWLALGQSLAAIPGAHPPSSVGPGASRKARPSAETLRLAEQLQTIRKRVVYLEQNLLDGMKSEKAAQSNVKKIKLLLELQKQEKSLGSQRLAELQRTIDELESRRGVLHEKIKIQEGRIRRSLVAIENSIQAMEQVSKGIHLPEQEKVEAPRRKLLANLVDFGVKEIEALRVDVADDEKLQTKIEEERHELVYLFQDLKEQESVLELNQELQVDLLKKNRNDHLAQLESYRKLKTAETQVESLIGDFNARKELERATEAEKQAAKTISHSLFLAMKGKLKIPLDHGKIISSFGRAYDPKSKLFVFKKGIDIAAGRQEEVRAIGAGKIAYSGELPDYGRVTIVDHGEHFYSLCAHLGAVARKTGDAVAAGDVIGSTDDSGTPVYFEIRSRNVAVNPLQWISN